MQSKIKPASSVAHSSVKEGQLGKMARQKLKKKGVKMGRGASQMVLVVKNPACQCKRHKRHRFNHWVRKIPWRAWQPIPVCLPGEFYGQRSLEGYSP